MSKWHVAEWEKFGVDDPYFGVISKPHMRAERIDEKARAEFFQSGESEIAETLSEMRAHHLSLGRALDFGCGVGRLTIPLARRFREVVGVDVAAAMIGEAQLNSRRAGVSNIEFKLSIDGLANIEGPFDFVHSFIVFQHIRPTLGYRLFDALLDRLSPTGCGMVHFTFGRRGRLHRWAHRVRRSSRLVHRGLNIVQGRPWNAPLMAMFEYDLNRLLQALEARGFDRVGGRLTNHGEWLGIMLAFSKSQRSAV